MLGGPSLRESTDGSKERIGIASGDGLVFVLQCASIELFKFAIWWWTTSGPLKNRNSIVSTEHSDA